MEALLKHLLVQTCAVEACLHREFDVVAKSLVGGSRPDAVGVEALVEYQTLVEGFVVEIHLVALHMYLAHAHIAAYLVDALACLVLHLVAECIEEGVGGTPQACLLDGQHDGAVVLCRHCLGGHHLLAVAHGDGQGGCPFAAEGGVHDDLALVDVGQHLCPFQSAGIHRLHPHGLPDACAACVHALKLCHAHVLLACGLQVGACVAVGVYHQRVCLSVGHKACDIHTKRGAAAEVASCQLAVDEDF